MAKIEAKMVLGGATAGQARPPGRCRRARAGEVLFRAGQALTLFEKNSNPELAIQYLDKAIERAMKSGIPANYYYTLGDAYRLWRATR